MSFSARLEHHRARTWGVRGDLAKRFDNMAKERPLVNRNEWLAEHRMTAIWMPSPRQALQPRDYFRNQCKPAFLLRSSARFHKPIFTCCHSWRNGPPERVPEVCANDAEAGKRAGSQAIPARPRVKSDGIVLPRCCGHALPREN